MNLDIENIIEGDLDAANDYIKDYRIRKRAWELSNRPGGPKW